MPKIKLVEIARSFSYKHNKGNYESVDFFCSQKAEVPEKDAEKKSEELYAFCRNEVAKSLKAYLAESEEENVEKPNLNGTIKFFPKIYKAKPTDSWRGDNSATYRAEVDEEGNLKKVLVNKDENTTEPQ